MGEKLCVKGPAWNNNLPGQHSTTYMASHGQVRLRPCPELTFIIITTTPEFPKKNSQKKIFASVNCFSQARCPPVVRRVPLYQVPSTPGCAASSVSSQMVSLLRPWRRSEDDMSADKMCQRMIKNGLNMREEDIGDL